MKATRLPPSSPTTGGADGLPYGVSSSTSSASSSSAVKPEPPKTPSSAVAGGVGIGELQVRDELPVVAQELLVEARLEHGQQRAQRLDPDLRLRQVEALGVELRVRELGDRRHRREEHVRHPQLLDLLDQLLAGGFFLSHGPALAWRSAPHRSRGGSLPPRSGRSAARRHSPRGSPGTEPPRA